MSVTLNAWAYTVRAPTSAAKAVLLSMADAAADPADGQVHKAFQAVATIVKRTQLNRKTVLVAIGLLESAGIIARTGERRGLGGIPVFMFNRGAGSGAKTGTASENGGDTEVVPFLRGSGPVLTRKSSQERDTERSELSERKDKRERARMRTPATKGTRLPENWQPTEADRAYATDRHRDVDAEAEAFRDYWLADATSKARKADWAAAWRTWIRKAAMFEKKNGTHVASFKEGDERRAREQYLRTTGQQSFDANVIEINPTRKAIE